MRLTHKYALVTAAGQGIGRAAALAFAREGAEVLATDINPSALASLAAEGHPRLRIRTLDVTDPEAIDAMSAAEQRATAFNVLFNCAGMVHAGNILESSEDELMRAWEIKPGPPQTARAKARTRNFRTSTASTAAGLKARNR